MRRLISVVTILIATGSVALAGGSMKDNPASAPLWSGFYLGAQAGGVWTEWNVSNAISTPGVGPFAAPGFPLGEFDGSGYAAGVHAGFNRQIGSLLIGLEADINWANVDSARDFLAAGIGAGLPFTVENSLEYYATLRARRRYAR